MNGCTMYGDRVPERIKSVIEHVSKRKHTQIQILAKINSQDFTDYVKAVLKKEDVLKGKTFLAEQPGLDKFEVINKNTFETIVRQYHRNTSHTVDSYTTNIGDGRSDGFSSMNAKTIAKKHTADIMKDVYYEDTVSNKGKKRSPEELIIEVNNRIKENYYTIVDEYANSVINNEEGVYTEQEIKAAKDYIQNRQNLYNRKTVTKEDRTKYAATVNEIERLTKIEEDLTEKLHSSKKSKQAEIFAQIQKNRKLIEEQVNIKKDLFNKIQEVYSKYPVSKSSNFDLAHKVIVSAKTHEPYKYTALQNYENLYRQANEPSKANNWYKQVFNTKDVTEIIKSFKNIGDLEEQLKEIDQNQDAILAESNESSIDETTKNWEDSLFKSITQTVNARVRISLSKVRNLSAPYDFSQAFDAEGKGKNQPLDTDNELGVSTYMNPQFIMNNIYSKGNFANREAFIQSLEDMSKINGLYGIGAIAAQCRANREYLNELFCAFSKRKVRKAILNISDVANTMGITFDISNEQSEPLLSMYYNLQNTYKNNYATTYNKDDANALDSIKLENISYLTGDKREKALKNAENIIANIISKYFPGLDVSIYDSIFDRNDPNYFKKVNDLLANIKDIVKDAGNYKTKINNKNDSAEATYNELMKEYTGEGDKPVKGFTNYYEIELDTTTKKKLLLLSAIFNNYSQTQARLQSTNAEGNSSSSIIKNNYVSRLIDAVQANVDGDANVGLKQLGSYFTQGEQDGDINQYHYNPILFGLRDIHGNLINSNNGVPIFRGMFGRVNGNVSINPKANQLLDMSLYDGTRNHNNNDGVTYSGMNKQDFFITQYFAFKNSTKKFNGQDFATTVDGRETAEYPMRIGSDAPKIFFIRSVKFNEDELRQVFMSHVLNEITILCKALNSITEQTSDNTFAIKTNTHNLLDRIIYNKTIIGKRDDGSYYLTGNAFKFLRLFNTGDYKAGEKILDKLSLYGVGGLVKFDENGNGSINLDNSASPIKYKTLTSKDGTTRGTFYLDPNPQIEAELKGIVNDWMKAYEVEIEKNTAKYIKQMNQHQMEVDKDEIKSFIMNAASMNMVYDDIFEGDFKLYKDARDSLKRMKESQAGGESYAAFDITDMFSRQIKYTTLFGEKEIINPHKDKTAEPYMVPDYNNNYKLTPMMARTGFRGITIYNTVNTIEGFEQIRNNLYEEYIKEGINDEMAHKMADRIAQGFGLPTNSGYVAKTKVNDAQSYITLDEFIRRRYADGTIGMYKDLLDKLLDPNVSAADINLDEINARIQVQKNFYYDKIYDETSGMFYSRQIKNAEFVLIPKLLPENSELRKVHDWMVKNDIGQLNTAETSKAGKKNIFTIFDQETGELTEDFNAVADTVGGFEDYIENYEYKYLYKQQDVPEHMKNMENKAGMQIMKKIIDNIIEEVNTGHGKEELVPVVEQFQNAYATNIREDFYNFLDIMGWSYDARTGRITNNTNIDENESLNYKEFFDRAIEEAARLGMDSNFIEYLTVDETGLPEMPNWMNAVAGKLENIAQAMFNGRITRQTLPGWHAAQITDVGYSSKLKFDANTGEMHVLIPRWDKNIPKPKNKEEEKAIIDALVAEGLDVQIAYRMPTEGKQSISKIIIDGFVDDIYGSTIVVPSSWVAQTGSDFDVDSVYGIMWEMNVIKTKDGIKFRKVQYNEEETTDDGLYINYVKNKTKQTIEKHNVSEEIKTKLNDLKDKIFDDKEINAKSKSFKKEDTKRNELYEKLPRVAQVITINANRQAGRLKDKDGKLGMYDIKKSYPIMRDRLNALAADNEANITEEERQIITQYAESLDKLINIMDAIDRIAQGNVDTYKEEKGTEIEKILNAERERIAQEYEQIAVEAGFLSREEFAKLPYIEKLSRRARNNYILDKMVTIMSHASSKEEQFGRSQFEDITNGEGTGANNIIDKIMGVDKAARSPYNPLDQLDYFEDVMSGARLKALSVNVDTFASKCNKIRPVLVDGLSIPVVINLENDPNYEGTVMHDEDLLRTSYDDDITDYNEFTENETNEEIVIDYNNVPGIANGVKWISMFTGAADTRNGKKVITEGGDSIWSQLAMAEGINVTTYSPQDYDNLSAKEMKEADAAYEQASKDMKRTFIPKPDKSNNESDEKLNDKSKLVRRDYMQIKNADQVFALGRILNPGIIGSRGRNNADHQVVDGGTGYGVQMAINLGKEVHVFDENENSWFVWDKKSNSFVKTNTPVITGNFAGIGSRKLNNNSAKAAKDVFNRSIRGIKNTIKESTSTSKTNSNKRNLRLYNGVDENDRVKYGNFDEQAIAKYKDDIIYAEKDNVLIRVPYEDIVKKLDDKNLSEIKDYINEMFDYPEFTKGQFAITQGIYDLVNKLSNDEFRVVFGNLSELARYFSNGLKERELTESILDSTIERYNMHKNEYDNVDDYLSKLIKNTGIYNNSEVPITRGYITYVSEDVINSDKYKQYPKAYALLLQSYKDQHNIVDKKEETTEEKPKGKKVLFNARRFGWSNNNRNTTGRLITPYTAQTTAHHLDAVKEGSVPNVNEYTFMSYKIMSAMGIDFETIISLMRQPAITEVANQYDLSNSVFFKSDSNIINDSLLNIIKDSGVVDTQTKANYGYKSYLASAIANPIVRKELANLLRVNINKYNNMVMDQTTVLEIFNELKNGMMPLDKKTLMDRININHTSDVYNGSKEKDLAFDIAVLLTFNNIRGIADRINALIMISNSDKYGAKPSMRENRKIIEDIENLRDVKNEDGTITRKCILEKDGVGFVDLIFPKNENGFIDVDKSEYKTIAAVYNFTTLVSNQVNTKLFITEDEDFAQAEHHITKILGRRLTNDEYKEYKRYIVSSVYNQQEKLLSAMTVNDRGQIIFNTELEKQWNTAKKWASPYWNFERTRINGYGRNDVDNFICKDVDNPTEDEMRKFNLLTPAQKVLYIKKTFTEGDDIFKYLNVTMYNGNMNNRKTLSKQYINYDDSVDNIEDLLDLFRRAFFNHNKLIKATAVDLVKYALISEGFNYKSGYITKLIVNQSMTVDTEHGGLDIIDDMNRLIKLVPNEVINGNLGINFIRSHSEYTKIADIGAYPKPEMGYVEDAFGNKTLTQLKTQDGVALYEPGGENALEFERCKKQNGVVVIPNGSTSNDTVENLIYKLGVRRNVGRFIRVSRGTKEGMVTELYYVYGNEKKTKDGSEITDFILIPTNTLNRDECYDHSYHPKNNKFGDFTELLKYAIRLKEQVSTTRDFKISKYNNDEFTEADIKMAIAIELSQNPKPVGDSSPVEGSYLYDLANESAFQNALDNKNQSLYGVVKNIVKKLETDPNGTFYMYLPNNTLNTSVPFGRNITQELKIGFDTRKYDIGRFRYKDTVKFVRERIADKSLPRGAMKEAIDEFEKVNPRINKENPRIEIYKIQPHIENTTDKISEVKEMTKQDDNADTGNIKRAATSLIAPPSTGKVTIAANDKIDDVSKKILKDIHDDAVKNDRTIAIQFDSNMRRSGVDRNMAESRKNNRNNIYVAASKYYRSRANEMLRQIEKYTDIPGIETSIDDVALYEALFNNEEHFSALANFILDCLTFGNSISTIMELDLSTEDSETKQAVEEIIYNINKVKQDTRIGKALDNIFNVYFKKYSTNPEVTNGILQLRETFGDMDKLDMWITDPAEIHNPEVQVVIKQIYGILNKAEMFDAKEAQEAFFNSWDNLMNGPETVNMDNIIDNDKGRLRQEFNDEFEKDKQKVIDDVNDAYAVRFSSVADYKKYLQAKLAKDKFMLEHTHQKLVDEYYEDNIYLEDRLLKNSGDAYVRYLMLKDQIRQYPDNDLLTPARLAEKQRLLLEAEQLASPTDVTGAIKTGSAQIDYMAIEEYKNTKKTINEKYFDTAEYEGFLNDYKAYKRYVTDYNNKHRHLTLEEKLAKDVAYREAFEWLKKNGVERMSTEMSNRVRLAFKNLTKNVHTSDPSVMKHVKTLPDVVDAAGIINPMKIPDDQMKLLKEFETNNLINNYENGYGEGILITCRPANVPQIAWPKGAKTKEEIEAMNSIHYKDNAKKFAVIGEINKILIKCVNINTHEFDINDFFNPAIINNDEKLKLIKLYQTLRDLKEQAEAGFVKKKNKIFYDVTSPQFFVHKTYRDKLSSKEQRMFDAIFMEHAADGTLVPNQFIYNYRMPQPGYEDVVKTEASKFLKDNIEFVTTEYYEIAAREAGARGSDAFDEWYRKNHIYNPYTHRYEPLKVWTKMQTIPGSEAADSVKYRPTFKNEERSVKEEYLNSEDKYDPELMNYRTGKYNSTKYLHGALGLSGRNYDSGIVRNKAEKELYKLIYNALHDNAHSYIGKRFINKGYLPRDRQTIVNAAYIGTQAMDMVGMSWRSGADSQKFNEIRDYTNDQQVTEEMLGFIKGKGYQALEKPPVRNIMEDDKAYRKRVIDNREKNRKITEANRAIDVALMNRDWKNVIGQFIHNATITKSKESIKPYMYLLLEDLKNNKAYKLKFGWDRTVMHKNSDNDRNNGTRLENMENTYDIVHNFTRRIIFDQFHENSKLRTTANFLQNMASAKYMVGNLYGGIANITTGEVNISMERFANEYFSNGEYLRAKGEYLQHGLDYLAHMWSDTSSSETGALIKHFNIVDFDQVLQFGAGSEGLDTNLRRARNLLYGFQSAGEHLMQNSVLLAMLDSHKLFIDRNGRETLGDFNDFTRDLENKAMSEVISNIPGMSDTYEIFFQSIMNNIQSKYDLSTGRRDINREFLYHIRNDKTNNNADAQYRALAEAYYKKRKELIESEKAKFAALPTARSMYKFDKNTGKVSLTDSYNNDKYKRLLGDFKTKVIHVNKKIHGVYDKNGAALIERTWWGSLVMQYHKHLFTGIMKRWRRRGYYSEIRGTRERGSYQTVIDFLSTEFGNMPKLEEGDNIVLKSIQNVIKAAWYAGKYAKFNWHNLSRAEQNNIMRNLADISGVLAACLFAMIIYTIWDDDEIKDSNFLSSLIYLSDRLYNDSLMYSPTGLSTEAKTAWSSPVASANGPSDLWKAVELIPRLLLDPTFNPEYTSGQYAGKNKLEVLLRRQMPGVRPYDRIMNITRNNKYYKIGSGHIGINLAKTFGEMLHD